MYRQTAFFSEREDMILKLVSKKKMTYSEIAKEVFKEFHNGPFDTEISVGNSVRRIISKCEHYNLNWTLTKTREGGKLLIKKEKV